MGGPLILPMKHVVCVLSSRKHCNNASVSQIHLSSSSRLPFRFDRDDDDDDDDNDDDNDNNDVSVIR